MVPIIFNPVHIIFEINGITDLKFNKKIGYNFLISPVS